MFDHVPAMPLRIGIAITAAALADQADARRMISRLVHRDRARVREVRNNPPPRRRTDRKRARA